VRILVTGSLGTLGRPLVVELRERGHEVWGTDLTHDGDPQYTRADVANFAQLERAFEAARPDAIYHLAAEFGRLNGEQYTEQLWRSAMVGTRNVLELSAEHDTHLLFASSSEVYGEAEEDLLDEELTDRQVIFHPNEYALSKWANERQILAFQGWKPELRATRLRFFNAYGPGEPYNPYRSVVALFCAKALAGEALPVFRGYHRTFMYIDDFIPTLANACEADLRHDVYNIGGTDFRSVEELAQIVSGEVADGQGEIELIPEDLHNVRSKRPDISRAREDLGHDPRVTLEEGVPPTAEWMRGVHARALDKP
jgi:dTDP-glucose 4,6-dehydratase